MTSRSKRPGFELVIRLACALARLPYPQRSRVREAFWRVFERKNGVTCASPSTELGNVADPKGGEQ